MDPLLGIDVDSELRKLATAALGGSQLPAELVRAAVSAGASRVDLQLDRRGLTVRDDGAPIPVEELGMLASLLDPEAPAAERHQALVALESKPGRLALAVPESALRIETGAPGRRRLLAKEPGQRPVLETLPAGSGSGTAVSLTGLPKDGASARRAALAACRFAPIPVRVDGVEIGRGFPDALAEAPLRAPLAGRLCLPRTGEGGTVLLLHDGVIAARLSVPDAPAFEAAVEMRSLVAGRGGGALREAAAPHIPALVADAVALGVTLGARLPALGPADAARVRAQLLVAARKRWQRSDILRLPLFLAIQGPEGVDVHWASLLDLGRDREVLSLEPSQDPGAFLLPAGPVLILDAEERGRLAQLLGLRFRAPEARQIAATTRARVRRALSTMTAGVLRVARRLRHPRLGEELPDRALGPGERALLKALRECDPRGRLVITDGAGPVRQMGERRWALPRHNPSVAACARAVLLDHRWAYPALYALLEDRAEPAPEGRRRWREGHS